MADTLDDSWFLDSEPQGKSLEAESSAVGFHRRPWQAHWPPKSKNDLHKWLSSEYPQVLSWRFNPDQPFDRPWRSWTRSTRAKKSETIMEVNHPDMVGEVGNSNCESPVLSHNRPCSSEISSTSNIDLDEQLSNLHLTSVFLESFNYLAPLGLYDFQKPYLSRLPCLTGLNRTNIVGQSYPVSVQDIGGHEDHFTLDKSGFQFLKLQAQLSSWTDHSVRSNYLPALSVWLKEFFSCDRVLIYAYNFRGNEPAQSDTGPWKSPFFRAHCDATKYSCAVRLQLHFPDEAEQLMKRRYRFINVWRPITGPEQDCPLALCDFRTVSEKDLVKADVVFPHYCDEGFELRYSPAHRWFYKKGMSTDEVIIFKLDDSSESEAKFCPHSAFLDPSAAPGVPKRASVEKLPQLIANHREATSSLQRYDGISIVHLLGRKISRTTVTA